MTDPALVAKKLAFIETCVRDLRTLAQPEKISHDLREGASESPRRAATSSACSGGRAS